MISGVKKLIGYGVASAAIVAGGAEGTNLFLEPQTFQESMRTEIEASFKQNVDYWVRQGLGTMANTKLVEVDGYDTYTCPGKVGTAEPNTEVLTAHSMAEVCLDTQTVVLTPNDMERPPGGVPFTVVHELGHVVGSITDQLKGRDWQGNHAALGLADELSATCYGGVAMHQESPAEIKAVADSIAHDMASDPIHGTGAEQAQAFMQGVQTYTIASCTIDHFLAQQTH